jgi:prepilin-type processing-associated H-X9-DG protein
MLKIKANACSGPNVPESLFFSGGHRLNGDRVRLVVLYANAGFTSSGQELADQMRQQPQECGTCLPYFRDGQQGPFSRGIFPLALKRSPTNAMLSVLPVVDQRDFTSENLLCPSDTKRKEAPNFTTLSNSNISYFVGLLTNSTYPQDFLAGDRNILVNSKPIPAGLFTFPTNAQVSWSGEMHQAQGNILMGDGSVQQFSTSRLREAFTNQGVGTNLLLFP